MSDVLWFTLLNFTVLRLALDSTRLASDLHRHGALVWDGRL